MPVQINEVVIRAVVGDTYPAANTTGSQNQGNVQPISEALLVERIMEIIKEKNER